MGDRCRRAVAVDRVGVAPSVGPEMNRAWKIVSRVAGLAVLAVNVASSVAAGDNYALVVTGASGGEAYASKYDGWRRAFVSTLREKFGYPADHVVVLAEREEPGVVPPT